MPGCLTQLESGCFGIIILTSDQLKYKANVITNGQGTMWEGVKGWMGWMGWMVSYGRNARPNKQLYLDQNCHLYFYLRNSAKETFIVQAS